MSRASKNTGVIGAAPTEVFPQPPAGKQNACNDGASAPKRTQEWPPVKWTQDTSSRGNAKKERTLNGSTKWGGVGHWRCITGENHITGADGVIAKHMIQPKGTEGVHRVSPESGGGESQRDRTCVTSLGGEKTYWPIGWNELKKAGGRQKKKTGRKGLKTKKHHKLHGGQTRGNDPGNQMLRGGNSTA